jgi:exosome complex RNA-binding protein Csl4
MGGGHFDRNGGGNRFSSPKPEKMCGIGDTILARVQYNDKDSYTLALNGPEMGVIFAKCEKCSGELEIKGERLLVCKDCTHKENRKISTLYNKPKEIKKLLILT